MPWLALLWIALVSTAIIGAFSLSGTTTTDFRPIGLGILALGVTFYALLRYAQYRYRRFRLAARLVRAGRFEEAVPELTAFIHDYETHPALSRWEALALGGRGLPAVAVAHFQLGVCAYQGTPVDAGAAQEAFQRAVALVPEFAEARFNACVCAAARGRRDEALGLLAAAVPYATRGLRERAAVAPELAEYRGSEAYQAFVAPRP